MPTLPTTDETEFDGSIDEDFDDDGSDENYNQDHALISDGGFWVQRCKGAE